MSEELHPLFVYGTLRPGAIQHCIVRPYVESSQIATVQGYQMYRFGRFPGLVKRPDSSRPVRGDLLVIQPNKYEECLRKLDKYESAGWLFDRILDHAQTDSISLYPMEPILCWLYVVREENLVVNEAGLVKENDWFEAHRG